MAAVNPYANMTVPHFGNLLDDPANQAYTYQTYGTPIPQAPAPMDPTTQPSGYLGVANQPAPSASPGGPAYAGGVGSASFNPDGTPKYPAYKPGFDPATESLSPWLTGNMGGGPGLPGVSEFSKLALDTGPSPWAKAASAQQTGLAADANERAQQEASSRAATADASLAMHGGLDSGAAERIQAGAVKGSLDAGQNAARQNSLNQAGISAQDTNTKETMLAGLSQSELDAKNKDIQRQIDEANNTNKYNMGMYGTQAQIYGANATANAQQQSGGSWLCSKVIDLSDHSKKSLKKLRYYSHRKNKVASRFYHYQCKPMVESMEKSGYDWSLNLKFVDKIVELTDNGMLEQARNLYIEHTKNLLKLYWPMGFDQAIKLEGISV